MKNALYLAAIFLLALTVVKSDFTSEDAFVLYVVNPSYGYTSRKCCVPATSLTVHIPWSDYDTHLTSSEWRGQFCDDVGVGYYGNKTLDISGYDLFSKSIENINGSSYPLESFRDVKIRFTNYSFPPLESHLNGLLVDVNFDFTGFTSNGVQGENCKIQLSISDSVVLKISGIVLFTYIITFII